MPPSPSETPQPLGQDGRSFDRLAPGLQRWIWDQGWRALRPFQEAAIEALLTDRRDLLLSASTASGKTEAVFLPLLSTAGPGLHVLYISPLKALINDQADRLEALAARVDVPVHRWHGDVGSHRKTKLLEQPSGVLLITPESLEALLVLRGPELATVFAALDTVVVDELHVFMGTERGRQLQCHLHRLDSLLGRSVRRVALSATLSDAASAGRFLRWEGPPPRILTHSDAGREVRLQVRAFDGESTGAIARHLFDTLKHSDNLVFCNRRRDVEAYSELLRGLEAQEHLPARFFPHHGSLAQGLREEVEARLRSGQTTTVVCTTTLELGIDFGQVTSVAQIDPPPSVSGLFQRLGRSGRRGAPSTLRVYVSDKAELRPALLQAAAMVSLLLERWMEPTEDGSSHLSTLVQQVLSLIAERHGVSASQAYRILCQDGPFRGVGSDAFALVLRALGGHKLVEQAADGALVLGEVGAKAVAHYSFYAAFAASEELTVKHQDRTVGTLPATEPLSVGSCFLLAGRPWKVVEVDALRRQVMVVPAPAGDMPGFMGTGVSVHDTVRQRMRTLYESDTTLRFLDAAGQAGLQAARAAYALLGLSAAWVVEQGDDVLLFPWRGDRILHTLRLQLAASFPGIGREQAWLRIRRAEAETVLQVVQRLARAGPGSALDLAAGVRNVATEKWDRYVPQELLWADYAARRLDVRGAWDTFVDWAERGY